MLSHFVGISAFFPDILVSDLAILHRNFISAACSLLYLFRYPREGVISSGSQ
jgi:hypothetical protein